MSNGELDERKTRYERDGLIVLRAIIPAALLADLRRQAERAREIARRERGPQTQRLQPVYRYPELDPRPFRDFLALPPLRAAVETLLGNDHHQSEIMGILFEPAETPWSTNWHRDWGHHVRGLDMDAFYRAAADLRMFNQLNGALYDDHSLWVVPGSHNRRDTAEELAAFPDNPPAGPPLTDAMTAEERELCCRHYVHKMPGSTPVLLQAGEVAFYRACGWHIGTYVPYARRATLHDGFYGPNDHEWQRRMKGQI